MPRSRPKPLPKPALVHAFLARLGATAKVRARLDLALEDEALYRKRFAKRRAERSQEDEPVDVWIEIIDALGEAKLACGIDWKFPAVDIAWNLRRVIAQKKLPEKKLFGFYDEDAHLQTKTHDFIAICGTAFSGHGFALVELDISSDSYELTIVPWGDVPKIQQAAKKIGGNVILHGPNKPLSAPIPNAPKKPIGKFQAVKLASAWGDDFEATNGVVRYDPKETVFFDCSAWPPKKAFSAPPRASLVLRDAERAIAHRVHHKYANGAFNPKAEGFLLVGRGRRAVDLLARLPDGFDLKAAGFCGELAIFLPTEPTVRGKHANVPVVWNGAKLALAKGLPRATPKRGTPKDRWPSFLRQGFARTGSGIDLLVWEGAAWTSTKTGAFTKVASIKDVELGSLFVGVPALGDAFYYATRTAQRRYELRLVSFGKAERTIAKIDRVLETPIAGPNGTIVFGCNRYAEPTAPVLVVFHPLSNELTEVPSAAFGVPRDEPANAYGIGGPAKDPWLWILDGHVVKKLAWSSVLALPRATA